MNQRNLTNVKYMVYIYIYILHVKFEFSANALPTAAERSGLCSTLEFVHQQVRLFSSSPLHHFKDLATC